MQIISIKNKHANNEVCPQYLYKELDTNKTELIVGKPLLIIFKGGSFFSHENIINTECLNDKSIRVETTNKTWILI